jgi:hypothetical protein
MNIQMNEPHGITICDIIPKPWNMYNMFFKSQIENWMRNQNPIFYIELYFNKPMNMNICSKYVIFKGNIP